MTIFRSDLRIVYNHDGILRELRFRMNEGVLVLDWLIVVCCLAICFQGE
jgi:hypothetical protein